ncbi:hypothetical protein JW872_02530 [Candidatus Babeliales bacterium]|nr:hypothetical protein [Candidatus Babeliales bacterium]
MKRMIVWVIAISGVCHALQWELADEAALDRAIERVASRDEAYRVDALGIPLIIGMIKRCVRTHADPDYQRLERVLRHGVYRVYQGVPLYRVAKDIGLDERGRVLLEKVLRTQDAHQERDTLLRTGWRRSTLAILGERD